MGEGERRAGIRTQSPSSSSGAGPFQYLPPKSLHVTSWQYRGGEHRPSRASGQRSRRALNTRNTVFVSILTHKDAKVAMIEPRNGLHHTWTDLSAGGAEVTVTFRRGLVGQLNTCARL